MNGNRNHTLYGVLFILACLIVAGALYAVIRSPTSQTDQPEQIMDNTQLNIEYAETTNQGAESTPVDAAATPPPRRVTTLQDNPNWEWVVGMNAAGPWRLGELS